MIYNTCTSINIVGFSLTRRGSRLSPQGQSGKSSQGAETQESQNNGRAAPLKNQRRKSHVRFPLGRPSAARHPTPSLTDSWGETRLSLGCARGSSSRRRGRAACLRLSPTFLLQQNLVTSSSSTTYFSIVKNSNF